MIRRGGEEKKCVCVVNVPVGSMSYYSSGTTTTVIGTHLPMDTPQTAAWQWVVENIHRVLSCSSDWRKTHFLSAFFLEQMRILQQSTLWWRTLVLLVEKGASSCSYIHGRRQSIGCTSACMVRLATERTFTSKEQPGGSSCTSFTGKFRFQPKPLKIPHEPSPTARFETEYGCTHIEG